MDAAADRCGFVLGSCCDVVRLGVAFLLRYVYCVDMETTQTTPATITGSKLKPGMTITDRGETLTLGKRIHCHRGSGCVGFIVNGARRAFHRDLAFEVVS